MPILVTGGAGFIGSHFIEALLQKDRQVLCLDNFNDYYSPEVKRLNLAEATKDERLAVVEGDICDRPLLDRLFSENELHTVVHLAARAGVRPSIAQPLLYEKNNCEGTLNLLECCRAYGVHKFIFASSSSVYGVSSRLPFAEDDPVDCPISPYAVTKRVGELYCYNYSRLYGIHAICLRLFTAYGPRQRPDMAIHKFTRLIAAGKPVTLYGSGDSRRDYTYVSDVVDGILGALECPLEFEIINLGSHHTVELRYLLQLIEDALGKKARIEQLPDQPGDVPVTYADVSKGRRLLGYGPTVSIEEGIEKFVTWFKQSQPNV